MENFIEKRRFGHISKPFHAAIRTEVWGRPDLGLTRQKPVFDRPTMPHPKRTPKPPKGARFLLALFAAALMQAAPAQASPLASAFADRSEATRIALQTRLAQAELFVGVVDGKWDGATERALLRGADKVAYVSNGQIKPNLRSPHDLDRFLDDLAAGVFDDALRPTPRAKAGWFGND